MTVKWQFNPFTGKLDKTEGSSSFLNLSDTPTSYSGEGGKGVRVDAGESSLEFYTIAGSTDEKTKVSSNDTTAGYLNGKLVAGTGISLTEGNDGGDETLTISHDMTEVLSHSDLTDMPDTGGTNTDHDSRYYTQTQVDNLIPTVDDTAYDATSWNANTDAATKNAIRDKIDSMDTSISLNTAKVSADGSIDTHSDVDTTTSTPNSNEVLAWDGSNWIPSSLQSANVSLLTIPTSTYETLQDWANTVQSTGKLSGGGLSDGGSGTLSVAAGTGFIKTTDSDVGTTKFFDWSANTSLSLVDNSTNYIYVEYNSGSPQITSATSMPSDKNTNLLLGLAYRDGTDLHIITAGMIASNYAKHTFWKDIEINGKFQRQSGLMISETGTRNFALTSGNVYAGLTKTSLSSFDSSGSDTFTYYYRDGSGGWTKVTSQTQIDNTQYDDGSGTLATLSGYWWGNNYGVHWIYEDIDGDVFVVYGQGDYTLSQANDAQAPSTLPSLLQDIGGLVGKIIIEKDASSFQSVQSAFDTVFSPSAVSNHNELGGLQGGTSDEYYHLTSTNHSDLTDGGDSALHYHATDRARANHTGTQTASTISDFDTEVSNNSSVSANTTHSTGDGSDHADVASNTTHRTSDGSDHTYIDQDVTSGSAPTFTADNLSDGGGNAIITTTQETNFESAYTHISSDGSDHTYIDQSVVSGASPVFDGSNFTALPTIDKHSDVDTTTDAPANNEVLKWNGSNWVPAPYDYDFAFSIASFSDGISDTNQLIGSGTWKGVGDISFTASYNNEPSGMTAYVAMSGSATSWSSNLDMTPTTGPETNTEAVEYPSSTGGTITFTLHQSADTSTDTESVSFNNTMRYGTNALTQGNQTEASLESLSEVSGPNESRSQYIYNIPSSSNYVVFAYADRLSDVAQVRRNHDGQGYVTASFNSTRTTVAPSIQTGITNVDNSAGYSETFAAITSTDTGLADGSDDFQLTTSSTPQNYIYWGELNKDAGADGTNQYTESDVENNIASEPGRVASNSISSRDMIVNCTASEYAYIAYPARLGALTSIVIGGFESLSDFWIDANSGNELAITNDAGFTEDYYVYVSKNPGFTDPTTMTVSI